MKIVAIFFFFIFVLYGSDNNGRYYSFEEACKNAGWTTGSCASKSQREQQKRSINLCKKSFHAKNFLPNCKINAVVASSTNLEFFVQMIGLTNISKINESKFSIWDSKGLKNAAAFFFGGERVIVFDSDWAKDNPEAFLIIGHEAGHHFCGHTIGSTQESIYQKELEADRFSGASIKRLEVYHDMQFLNKVIKAAKKLYPVSKTRSHPSRFARINAILKGYNHGSPCGNLAPPIRGFSRLK